MTLDGRKVVFDLTPEQRRAGATFNRFGLANVRGGGHSLEFYLDDLSDSARGPRPKPVPQTLVEVPDPHKQAGRRYSRTGMVSRRGSHPISARNREPRGHPSR